MKNILFFGLILLLGLTSCTDPKNANELDGTEIQSASERISIAKRELVLMSEIEDAEFRLFNVNGFSNSRTLLPGASSRRL